MSPLNIHACAVLAFLLTAAPVFAQTKTPEPVQTPPPAAPQTPTPDAAPVAEPGARRAIRYGVRFGPAFTSLTSVEPFDATVVAAGFEPTMNFGGFVTVHMLGPLALQPEVLFAAKGERIHQQDAKPIVSGTGTKPPPADRVVLVRYLEIPLLLRASKRTHADSSFYAIAGPALAMRRNAVIRQVADPGKLEDISPQVSGSNFSLVYGAGFQHQRWMVDARFTKGLRNIAVAPLTGVVKTSGFAVLMGVRL
jgi:hypothetical protein